MKPCHLFRRGGTCFVYHVAAGRFIRTDPAAYEYLRLRSALPKPEAESRFLAAFPERKDVLSDCGKLEAEGFFEEAPATLPDDSEFDAEYDRRFNGACNNLVLSVASGCNLACRYCYCGVCRDELPDSGLMSEATATT
jgi:sulfatase maturation enzyme AslB (radical SAM superfamily)